MHILVETIDDEVPVGELSNFHGAVCAAGEEPVLRVDKDLGDALADVLEDAVAGVFLGEGVEGLVGVHRPDLDVPGHGAGDEELLVGVEREALDGVLVGLEEVHLALGAEVPDRDLVREKKV